MTEGDFAGWNRQELIAEIIRLHAKVNVLVNSRYADMYELSERRHADGEREAYERGKAGIYG